MTQHLLENIASNYQQPVPTLQETALEALQRRPFPGNMRELENILERTFTLCENGINTLDDLGLLELSPGQESSAAPQEPMSGEDLEDYLVRIEKDILLQRIDSIISACRTSVRHCSAVAAVIGLKLDLHQSTNAFPHQKSTLMLRLMNW